ncbi:MAG: shikimate dehydrogenase [Chlorobiaceae bacterium]|nr:shikimate dehydrogenase [Chlorobiaceae bacterium]MBA4310495.1 shikimate dehydrogenase [Chlorobiaceae bacterium]
MKNLFHTNTKIIGLLGHPIKHSFSPFIHNLACQILELDYVYLPLDVMSSSLKNALKGIVALNIKGFNVTIPHKEKMLSYVHQSSEEATICGAVNTVVNDMGKLYGYNTDVYGILETLLPYKDEIINNEVTLFGAGGAARSVIYTLARHFRPSRINIVNRTEQRAETLKEYFNEKMKYDNFMAYELFPHGLLEVLRGSKLIINATSVGMYPEIDDTIISLSNAFQKDQIVFDLVYNPPKSQLLKIAESEGAVTLNGIKMLVYQGAKSFELWTGQEMPVDKVMTGLENYISI